MSTARGGVHRGGQTYQNKFAFKHNKGSKKTARILSIQHQGLCNRCNEKIEWRKKFRKYKPIKQPLTCRGCEQRNVHRAYHTLCHDCASTRKVCPMCQGDRTGTEAEVDEELRGARQANAKEVRQYSTSLRERDRRRLLRELDSGLIRLYKKEDGTMFTKRYELDDDDDDDEGDEEGDSEDEEEDGELASGEDHKADHEVEELEGSAGAAGDAGAQEAALEADKTSGPSDTTEAAGASLQAAQAAVSAPVDAGSDGASEPSEPEAATSQASKQLDHAADEPVPETAASAKTVTFADELLAREANA
mmetsp:Transcript_19370/g.62055  ORF Transcript_19370/g.62055 Transcript_19370/m.62055 type:complete len:305 (+) Transcript_19370:132-1046(+)